MTECGQWVQLIEPLRAVIWLTCFAILFWVTYKSLQIAGIYKP